MAAYGEIPWPPRRHEIRRALTRPYPTAASTLLEAFVAAVIETSESSGSARVWVAEDGQVSGSHQRRGAISSCIFCGP